MLLTYKDYVILFSYIFLISMCLASVILISYGIQINYGPAVTLGIFYLGLSSILLITFFIRKKIKDKLKERKYVIALTGIIFAILCGMAIIHNLMLILWKFGYPIDANINKSVLSSFFWWISITIIFPLLNYSFFMELPKRFFRKEIR
jgi:hypothetical protein